MYNIDIKREIKEVKDTVLNQRNHQRGSVATFLLVGLVLAAMAVGGVYYVQQNSNSDNAPKSSPTPSVASSPTKQPTSSKPHTNKTHGIKVNPSYVGRQGTTTTPMPETGPTDTLFTILMAGLLSGLIVAYVRSLRSTRRDSLLD